MLRWILMVALALTSLSSCGKAQNTSGSNTNWLDRCSTDADCGGLYNCWCGVCTEPCTTSSECANASATCLGPNDVECTSGGPSGSACVEECASDADCSAAGEALTCSAGVCRPEGTTATRRDALGIALLDNGGCVSRAGKVWCFGANDLGQVGRAPSDCCSEPTVEAVAVDGVVELAGGSDQLCARRTDGSVWCWGGNAQGQVGPISAPDMTCSVVVLDKGPENRPCQPTPTAVPGIAAARQLALGVAQSCALLADGTVRCWGASDAETDWLQALPEPATHITLGNAMACAHLADGAFTCSPSPTLDASAWPDVSSFAMTAYTGGALDEELGCAIRGSGRVDCWGVAADGERGDGTFDATAPASGRSPAVASGARQLAVGGSHACARLDDGSVRCWGSNSLGEVGLPPLATPYCATRRCVSTPHPVDGLPTVTSIAASAIATCATTSSSQLFCWGYGPLWSGSFAPMRVPGPWEDATAECAGAKRSLANAVLGAFAGANTACQSDADCTEIALQSSCYSACRSAPVSIRGAQALETAFADIDATECGQVTALGCSTPTTPCADPVGTVVCDQGTCTRFDSATAGCLSPCECSATERAPVIPTSTCAGPDLFPTAWTPCSACGSYAYFVIANAGDTQYTGDVTIEPLAVTGAPPLTLPTPLSVSLSLAPGAHTTPLQFHFTDGPSQIKLRVTEPGDCRLADVDDSVFDTPALTSCQ